MIPKVFLKDGREKSLRQGHPWVFSGAVARVDGTPADGGTVDLHAADGAFLARACWNGQSQIAARVWSWRDEPIDRAFFARRIAESASRRASLCRGDGVLPSPRTPLESGTATGAILISELRSPQGCAPIGADLQGQPYKSLQPDSPCELRNSGVENEHRANGTLRGFQGGGGSHPLTNAFRVVNGEADLLPGLIVDRYAEFLSIQVLTLAMARRLPEIVEILAEQFRPRGIWQRSDVEVRRKEGLALETGLLYGEAPPPLLEIRENGIPLLVDLHGGQKTGFFLDQRDNRRLVGDFLRESFEFRQPKFELLNAFSYSGGFGVYASRAVPGCRVTNLDASAGALALAKANAELNVVPAESWDYLEGDAFKVLRTFRDSRRSFDAIVLDPPKFAQSKSQVEGACRGYKDLNLLAFKLLRPGGLLFTFSCSGGVSAELFQKVVAGASADAGREAQVLAHLGPGPDHPTLLSFPEGEYLKGLAVRCL